MGASTNHNTLFGYNIEIPVIVTWVYTILCIDHELA